MEKTTDDSESVFEEPLELPGEQPRGVYKKPGKSKKILKVALIGLVTILVLGSLGYGGGKYLHNHKEKPKTTSSTAVTKKTADTTGDVEDVTKLKTFTSDTLSMQISYPSNWTASEKGDGVLVVSPDFSYQTVDKGNVTGNFHVYMRLGARDVDGKYIGQGTAITPSTALSYSQPGSTQRHDTAFTQFGSVTGDHFTFFMVTGDYNLKKDDQLGPTYGREASTYIIVGGYGTTAQVDDLNFNNVPLSNYATRHVYSQAVNIVKSLKLN